MAVPKEMSWCRQIFIFFVSVKLLFCVLTLYLFWWVWTPILEVWIPICLQNYDKSMTSNWHTVAYLVHRESKSQMCLVFIPSVCSWHNVCLVDDGLCLLIDTETPFLQRCEELIKLCSLLQENYNVLIIWWKVLLFVCRVLQK